MPTKAEEMERERAEKARTSYGVFVWSVSNTYRGVDALAVYKHKGPAQRKADKLNEGDNVHVVRKVYAAHTST